VLVEFYTKDQDGQLADIVLGYDNPVSYEGNVPGFGAMIGRHANRIGDAEFVLNGTTYMLAKNDGKNNLHSGPLGYQKRIWDAQEEESEDGVCIAFTLHSPDQDQGYPGNLDVKVSYTLTEDDRLILAYEAKSDADTVFNMTNHSYFNLSGHDSGDVLSQKVWIDSDQITDADQESIPHGGYLAVQGTPMDFNVMKPIGEGIDADYEQLVFAGGYDHNWVLKTKKGELSLVAKMADDQSGRMMEVYTDLPGLQFYTGNFLDGTEKGKGGVVYQRRAGACFETQFYPNSPNVPEFPSCILKANQVFRTKTVYKFYAE
jgi:aldose 1-epimerase